MKFRDRIEESQAIKKFHAVLVAAGKLSKTTILRLTKDKVYLTPQDAINNTDGVPCPVWMELFPEHYFSDYSLEGVTREENQILMEVKADEMAKNLTQLKSSGSAAPKALKVKLARKHEIPCLSFEIESGCAEQRVSIIDFPIVLIPRKRWGTEIKDPPSMAEATADVSLYMPDTKRVRHLADRYKSLGQHVEVTGARDGKLTFTMSNERVEISTFFKNLEVPKHGAVRLAGNVSTGDADAITATVRVEMKKLSSLLGVADMGFKRTLANFLHNQSIHFIHFDETLIMQYILPTSELAD